MTDHALRQAAHAGPEFPTPDSPFWKSPALTRRNANYPEAFEGRVPMFIRARFTSKAVGERAAVHAGQVYPAQTDSAGSVSAVGGNGALVALLPDDFVVVSWFDAKDTLAALVRQAARQMGLSARASCCPPMDAVARAIRPIPAAATCMAPSEACGLIVLCRREGLICVHSANRATPNEAGVQEDFALDAEVFRAADERGDIIAVWHTHPNGDEKPSEADQQRSHELQIPYLIYSLPAEAWHLHIPPPPAAPAVALIGRGWHYGVLDCFTLVRDWYLTHGLVLPHFEREPDWWFKGQNLYLENLPQNGFERVGERGDRELFRHLRRGDLLLYQLAGSPVPQHAAIYEGDGVMVHHPQDRLSVREAFTGQRGFWIDRFHSAWRHPHFA